MRRPTRYVVCAAALLLLPAAMTAGLAARTMWRIDRLGRDALPPSASLPPAHIEVAHGKLVAVVLVSNEMTEVTDLLAPYAILSASGAFNVFTVAPRRQVSDIWPGVAILPDLSFADFDARFPHGVDLIVVPYFGDYDNPALIDWLRGHADGAHVLSICEGGRTVAAAGLLTGRKATSHFYALTELEEAFPETTWLRTERAVADGNIISSAGVTAAVDAALLAVRGLAGGPPAAQAARVIGYEAPADEDRPLHLTAADMTRLVMRAAYDWDDTEIGIVLAPGVDEIRLAAHLDTHPRTFTARTMTLAVTGEAIRSRFGLTLYPRGTLDTAPPLDRLMRPDGSRYDAVQETALNRWADQRGLRIEEAADTLPLRAYDEQLLDIAAGEDVAASLLVAKLIEHPTHHLTLPAANGSRAALLALQPLALGIAGATMIRRLIGRGTRRKEQA